MSTWKLVGLSITYWFTISCLSFATFLFTHTYPRPVYSLLTHIQFTFIFLASLHTQWFLGGAYPSSVIFDATWLCCARVIYDCSCSAPPISRIIFFLRAMSISLGWSNYYRSPRGKTEWWYKWYHMANRPLRFLIVCDHHPQFDSRCPSLAPPPVVRSQVWYLGQLDDA